MEYGSRCAVGRHRRRAAVWCLGACLALAGETVAQERPTAPAWVAAPAPASTASSRSPAAGYATAPPPPPSATGNPPASSNVPPAATPLTPAGPSPSGADVPVLPIDLPTVLRLVNASNPTIAVARARVEEAYARLSEAQVMWLPNLEAGPSYQRHDGLLQTSTGNVVPVSKWNLFAGGGAAASLDTSEAYFGLLVARRLVQAQEAASQAVTNDIQLDVALAYLDLLRAYGALAINTETLTDAQEMLRLAEAAERNGFGKTPADATRARTEVDLRKQERINLEEEAGVVSARLTQLLLLEPTADLRPADAAVLPIALVPTEAAIDEMVATGLLNRPELAESRALVEAALARWRQARIGPLLPRLELSYLAGEFGGGTQDNTQRFGGRGDGTAQAVWTLHNFGFGDLARARVGRAQYDQATAHISEVGARVAAEVAAAAKVVRSRQRTLDLAQHAVQQAEETWRRLHRWTIEVGFRARQYEALELLVAEQQLTQARLQYLSEVIEFDKAQFRLYHAMGEPPLTALPKACALPVSQPPAPPMLTRTEPPPRKGPPVEPEPMHPSKP